MPSKPKTWFLFSGIGLGILWLALSGHYTPFLLALGAASVALTLIISIRMDVVDRESMPVELNLIDLPIYWLWLLKEILKCDLEVCRIILNPKLPIAPRIVTLPISQKTIIARVTHANSITLTPGTVTIDINEDEIAVHALNASAAESLLENEMGKRVSRLERSPSRAAK